jgi:hypothetical protein
MPTARAIRDHWALFLTEVRKFTSEFDVMDQDNACFACGHAWDENDVPEKAHILARCDGGSDTAENLHMLCHECHKTSETLSGYKYWAWFYERTIMDRIWQVGAMYGMNLNPLIQKLAAIAREEGFEEGRNSR